MRNYIKLFGVIAFAAVIGFSMVSCDNGGGSGGGSGDIEYWVDWYTADTNGYGILDKALEINFDWSTEEDRQTIKHIYELLQFSDLIFTPNDVIAGDGATTGIKNGDDLFKNLTVLKSGTVTVTIKPIDGHKFYPDKSYSEGNTKNGNVITVTK